MKFKVFPYEGHDVFLTTESPASHYGVPALRIEDDSPTDYGPADLVDERTYAADLVVTWGVYPERTSEEIGAARKFLAQWPEGPQLITEDGMTRAHWSG